MAIASTQELARTFENEVRGVPRAVRTWAVVLDDQTLTSGPPTPQTIASELELDNWGEAHPDFEWMGLRKVSITERFQDSPYHVQVVAEYGVLSANDLLEPAQRTAEWSFESQGSEVPALFYFDDDDVKRPLTNSAYDYFEGLTTTEQLVKATIKKNYSAWADVAGRIAANHKINSDEYLGCPVNSWKVSGVTAAWVKEVYNNVEYEYWATTCELLYRQSGWLLLLPDVGWNYIEGGQKRRAMVFDFENGEWVASPNPVGLDGSGGINMTTHPTVLDRRVNDETAFAALFGTPPEGA